MPSLFRSVVRGEDCDPITGKSFNQITSVGFFEEVREQPENITTTIIAIAPAVEKNWILTKEILLDKMIFTFHVKAVIGNILDSRQHEFLIRVLLFSELLMFNKKPAIYHGCLFFS